jgi:hypothetical protein
MVDALNCWSGCAVLQKVAGWLRIPDETTLGRLFKEVRERQVSEIETFVHVLRRKVWQRVTRSGTSKVNLLQTLWIDVDSSVKTVCGKQEGSPKVITRIKRVPVPIIHNWLFAQRPKRYCKAGYARAVPTPAMALLSS